MVLGPLLLLAEVLDARVSSAQVAVELHLLSPGVLEALQRLVMGVLGELGPLPLDAHAARGGVEVCLSLAESGVGAEEFEEGFVGRSHGKRSVCTRLTGVHWHTSRIAAPVHAAGRFGHAARAGCGAKQNARDGIGHRGREDLDR